jgi:LmbE family N-acetylglucosaminyl deacetylase
MDLAPPGVTTKVTADTALVIAPHFDDDVLGCGGLIAQLTAAGTEVCVLFLTDGSGGVEQIADRAAYAERRHGEAARALEILGVTDIEFADLPDGSLSEHLDDAAQHIRRALTTRRPDLLLAISPLEISADHRSSTRPTIRRSRMSWWMSATRSTSSATPSRPTPANSSSTTTAR